MTGASFGLEGVSVRFDAFPALSDVDLRIDAGEAVALVGPSGSGKTTLLRLLNGTVRPSAGAVRVDGERLDEVSRRRLRDIRSRLGFVPQDLALVPNLRVVQNVLSGRLGRWSFLGAARALLAPPRALVREVHALLDRVGVAEKLYQRTDRLSGGQRQRVAVARALFQEPSGLLADEPVSSVDPARARDTVRLLTELSSERRITLVMSLHNLELARAAFPRLVGLRRGRVVFDAPSDDVPAGAFEALYDLTTEELLGDGA